MDRRRTDRRTARGRRRFDALDAAYEFPRVLVIDGHADTRLLLTTVFEDAGYAAYAASDGIAGVALAEHRLPDVVITEISVPGIDGFEILRHLRERVSTADIPVVVVTSMVRADVLARAQESGAAHVLTKPADLDRLLATVSDVIHATPGDQLVHRYLRRALLTLRRVGAHVGTDESGRDRVRALIDRLQVAVLAFDEHGRYVAASAGACKLTGYTRDELLRMSVSESRVDIAVPTSEALTEDANAGTVANTATVRDEHGRCVLLEAETATVLPGLHAAALASKPGTKRA